MHGLACYHTSMSHLLQGACGTSSPLEADADLFRALFFQSNVKSTCLIGGMVLQDLVAADRFGIVHLKSLCENAAQLNVTNAARLFELGDLLSARRLREVSVGACASLWGLEDLFH